MNRSNRTVPIHVQQPLEKNRAADALFSAIAVHGGPAKGSGAGSLHVRCATSGCAFADDQKLVAGDGPCPVQFLLSELHEST
ncbi:MAG: hypothetical protein ACLQVL_08675 [Terriglobia bacterium]